MEINAHEESKLVDIWLTQAERDDDAFQEALKPLYRAYKAEKYQVAVFCSGSQDLAQQTGGLLCYNKKRIAELEIRQEKAQDIPQDGQGGCPGRTCCSP